MNRHSPLKNKLSASYKWIIHISVIAFFYLNSDFPNEDSAFKLNIAISFTWNICFENNENFYKGYNTYIYIPKDFIWNNCYLFKVTYVLG